MWAVLAAAAATFSSCELEYYKEELYRKEIYLVSGENNIFEQEFQFGGDYGYVSVYAGGTLNIDKSVTVQLAKDYEAIEEYNKRNFDTDYSDYAQELPADTYTIENMTVVLDQDSAVSYGVCPVKVYVDELLDDQTYFIPLRIESVSDYMASPTKNFVLLKVCMKNEWATTKTRTYYTMRGLSQGGTFENGLFVPEKADTGEVIPPQNITSSKIMVPTGQRSMRTLPAARGTNDDANSRNWAMSVIVDPIQTMDIPILDRDGQPTDEFFTVRMVSLSPYNDSANAVEIVEIPEEPCYYDSETKTFVLNYFYKIPGEKWYRVSESMYDTRY